MVTPLLPADFKEFLKLLNSRRVEYLLIVGYAVGYYGYPLTRLVNCAKSFVKLLPRPAMMEKCVYANAAALLGITTRQERELTCWI